MEPICSSTSAAGMASAEESERAPSVVQFKEPARDGSSSQPDDKTTEDKSVEVRVQIGSTTPDGGGATRPRRPKSVHARLESGSGVDGLSSTFPERPAATAGPSSSNKSLGSGRWADTKEKLSQRRAKSAGPSPFNDEKRTLVSIQTNFIVEKLMKAPRTRPADSSQESVAERRARGDRRKSRGADERQGARSPASEDLQASSSSVSSVSSSSQASAPSSSATSRQQSQLDDEQEADDESTSAAERSSNAAHSHWKHAKQWLQYMQQETAERNRRSADINEALERQRRRKAGRRTEHIVERYNEVNEVRRVTRNVSRERRHQLNELLEASSVRLPGRAISDDHHHLAPPEVVPDDPGAGQAHVIGGDKPPTADPYDGLANAVPEPPPMPDNIFFVPEKVRFTRVISRTATATAAADDATATAERVYERRPRKRHRRQRKSLPTNSGGDRGDDDQATMTATGERSDGTSPPRRQAPDRPLSRQRRQRKRQQADGGQDILRTETSSRSPSRDRRRSHFTSATRRRRSKIQDNLAPAEKNALSPSGERGKSSNASLRREERRQKQQQKHNATGRRRSNPRIDARARDDPELTPRAAGERPGQGAQRARVGLAVDDTAALSHGSHYLPLDSGIAGDMDQRPSLLITAGVDDNGGGAGNEDATPCQERPPPQQYQQTTTTTTTAFYKQVSNVSLRTLTSLDQSSSSSCFTAASTTVTPSGDSTLEQALDSSCASVSPEPPSNGVFFHGAGGLDDAMLRDRLDSYDHTLMFERRSSGNLIPYDPSSLYHTTVIDDDEESGWLPGPSVSPLADSASAPTPTPGRRGQLDTVGSIDIDNADVSPRRRQADESAASDGSSCDDDDGDDYDEDEDEHVRCRTPFQKRPSFFERLEGIVKDRCITVKEKSFQLVAAAELGDDYQHGEAAFGEFREQFGDCGFSNAAPKADEEFRLPQVSKEEIVLMRIIEIAESIEEKYSEEFDNAIADVTSQNLTFTTFSSIARSFLGGSQSPRNIWAVLGFSRRVVEELPSSAELVSGYTTRLLEEEALDYVNDKGGWGTMLKNPDIQDSGDCEVEDNDRHFAGGGFAMGQAVADGLSALALLFSPAGIDDESSAGHGAEEEATSQPDGGRADGIPSPPAATAEDDFARLLEQRRAQAVENNNEDSGDEAFTVLADSDLLGPEDGDDAVTTVPSARTPAARTAVYRSRMVGFGATSTAQARESDMPGFGHEVKPIDKFSITSEEWNGLLEHVRSNLVDEDTDQRHCHRRRSHLRRFDDVFDDETDLDASTTCASDSCLSDSDSSSILDSMDMARAGPQNEISIRRYSERRSTPEVPNDHAAPSEGREETTFLERIGAMGIMAAGAAVLAGISFIKQQS